MTMEAIALRLCPQQDLLAELETFIYSHKFEAACVLSCVGSLTTAVLRLASQNHGTTYTGYFEIVSLTGMLSVHGLHCHIAIADSTGRTIGGHVLKGCRIYTTAELVLGILPQVSFRREPDLETGYKELVISKCPPVITHQLRQ